MSNTHSNEATAPAATITVRVLYNDAVVSRNSSSEEALRRPTEDGHYPGGPALRMSDWRTGRDPEVDRVMTARGGMSAFSRVLTGAYYQPGDPLLEVLVEEVPHPGHKLGSPSKWGHAQCERLFALLNVGHPDGWSHRSMCIGDVVVVGESAWECDTVGFAPVAIDGSEIKEADRG